MKFIILTAVLIGAGMIAHILLAVRSFPVAPVVNVSMVGDSITFLKNVATTWPALTGIPGTQNNGVPSETTSDILLRLPAILAQNPKSVFFLGGVNDITTGLSRAQTVANIQTAITSCQRLSIPIYVQAILPVTPNYSNLNPAWSSSSVMDPEIAARNTLIQTMVATMGPGVTWLDWSGQLGLGDFQADGIHPLLSGDQKWAAAIAPYTALYR